jgi:hypothetical protein
MHRRAFLAGVAGTTGLAASAGCTVERCGAPPETSQRVSLRDLAVTAAGDGFELSGTVSVRLDHRPAGPPSVEDLRLLAFDEAGARLATLSLGSPETAERFTETSLVTETNACVSRDTYRAFRTTVAVSLARRPWSLRFDGTDCEDTTTTAYRYDPGSGEYHTWQTGCGSTAPTRAGPGTASPTAAAGTTTAPDEAADAGTTTAPREKRTTGGTTTPTGTPDEERTTGGTTDPPSTGEDS